MEKLILLFLISVVLAKSYAEDPPAESFGLTPAVTELSASSTNTTAGTIKQLYGGETPVTIWASCSGIPATTNGVSAVSNIVVKMTIASGRSGVTNLFTTPAFSNIKVTIPAPGSTTTNVASDWFVLTGVRYIRVNQIENNTLGIVSNITINVGYPKQN